MNRAVVAILAPNDGSKNQDGFGFAGSDGDSVEGTSSVLGRLICCRSSTEKSN